MKQQLKDVKKKINYKEYSLKETKNNLVVIETFIVEDNINFLGALKEENVKKIEFVPFFNKNKETKYIVGNR